jgi:acyl-coenzyme A synthetase/AMP-(fatty) acid ligase
MRESRVTVFPGVPTVFALLIAAHARKPLSFPSVRWITNTAAALPVDYFPQLREIFPNGRIFPMYGLTECKRVAYLEPELIDERRGSVGKAIPGTEVFLRSPEGDAVADGEPGILHVRGPHVMRGYWNLPSRSAEMLLDGDIPGEQVLRTGDWFRMDEDGFLYFVGRTDDIIKSRGEKVSPVEVESALYAVPGVVEAAVIGVPDEVLGQAIKAFVVVKEGSELEARRLRKELTDRLENFMVPQEFVFMNDLPKSENGKIRKKDLA